MNLIELNLHKMIELCRRYKVKTMSVFGSVLTNRFREDSDVDILVDFEPFDFEKEDYVRNYMDLHSALQSLFNRKVDLIEERALHNKYVLESVNQTKRVIYG